MQYLYSYKLTKIQMEYWIEVCFWLKSSSHLTYILNKIWKDMFCSIASSCYYLWLSRIISDRFSVSKHMCLNWLPVNAKHSSFQYLHSYIRVLMIFSTKYCGFVPLTEWASFTVRFAIFNFFFSNIRGVPKEVNLFTVLVRPVSVLQS